MTAPLTNQREAGEGRDREQEKKLEDRTKWFQEGVMMISDGLNSRWDTIELKKGTSQTTVQFAENIVVRGKDIDGKWEDFERLPFGEMKSPRLDGSSNYESTNEGEVTLFITITHLLTGTIISNTMFMLLSCKVVKCSIQY